MAESTLTLVRSGLKTAVAAYLGGNRTYSSTSSETQSDIDRIVAIGQRQFYAPSYRPVPNAPLKVHVWSFLRASASISISSSTQTYDMPDAFSGFLSDELNFTSTKTWPVQLTWMEDLNAHIQDYGTSITSAIPQVMLAALESKTSALGTTGQRWTLKLWPTPNASATLTAQYRLSPDALGDDTYYPLGGELHADTLLESCLAAAEEHINDQLSSIHRDRFAELLNQSILLDQRLHQQEAA